MKLLRGPNLIGAAVCVLATAAFSCGYRADRCDELVVTRQSDQYNLYRNVRLEVLDDLNRPDYPGDPPDETVKAMVTGAAVVAGAGKNAYATISVLTNRTPPLVQGYSGEVGKKSRKLLFSVPLTQHNSLLLRNEPNGVRTFQVLLSLRYDTLIPIVFKNNYELFLLTLRHDMPNRTWEISELKAITAGKNDAVQGVFSSDGDSIAYVESDRGTRTRLIHMKRDGSDRKVIMENALLPCFTAAGDLLFVADSGLFRDFRIYSPKDGGTRPASDGEIAALLRSMPYSALKEFYLRFEKKEPDCPLIRRQSLRRLFEYGLRNSPVVLQSYYEYLSVKARNTQNLFDIGPDFFMGADYLVTSSIFFNTPNDQYYVIGDRIGNDNFIRFITGFSIPVIPNLSLRWAQRSYDDWREQYGRASILKSLNEYTGRLSRLAFDQWQAEAELAGLDRQLARNAKRLERFRRQLDAGYGTSERVLFAENIHAGLNSERNAVAERLILSQAGLAALIGRNPENGVAIASNPDIPERLKSLHARHSEEWFQAQARVNRQELRLLDALIQQDAATRDMGPERTRIDAIRIRISYGVGFLDWSRLVDDFLLMGVSYAIPMRLPIFFDSYYKDYGNRIQALRMNKYFVAGAIEGEVLSAWGDYSVENGRAAHRVRRSETVREQSRIAGLLQTHGTPEMMPPERDADEYTAEMESLAEQVVGSSSQYERLRRLSSLYQAAGRSDLFLSEMLELLDCPPARVKEGKIVKTLGLYLWNAPEVVASKAARNAFFRRCEENGIKLVYCYFSMKSDRVPFLQKMEPEYAFFLEGCKRRGIKVFGLIGEPTWLDPAQRRDMRLLLNAYLEFNRERAARGEAGFDGLSLDVEPHSEPGWKSGRQAELTSWFLSLLSEAGDTVGKENLNVAIPDTYDGMPTTDGRIDLLQSVAERCESLTLMDYRANPVNAIAHAEAILAREELKTDLFVALETNPVEEPGVSYYGMSRADFGGILAECAGACSPYANFSGMVVNDDSGFSMMR